MVLPSLGLTEGIGSLLGWRKGVTRRRPRLAGRLSGVAEKLAGNNGPRSSLSIGPGFGRCGGFRWEFAKKFTERIEKLAGNMLGDH
ncbi:hypothetical protein GW17_00056299 [Ensete ventricosum]|nr:hypothetical protein GW17_00056299 [Ensete ventricosum]